MSLFRLDDRVRAEQCSSPSDRWLFRIQMPSNSMERLLDIVAMILINVRVVTSYALHGERVKVFNRKISNA